MLSRLRISVFKVDIIKATVSIDKLTNIFSEKNQLFHDDFLSFYPFTLGFGGAKLKYHGTQADADLLAISHGAWLGIV